MVKALHFKGDKKAKKRKRVADPNDTDSPASKALTTSAAAAAENDAAAAQDDDSWVNADSASDISGPIVVVLPTDPITFLACDANGKVFCSEVENSFEGKAETAEPHDVRQVWVANRVAGTENLSLKGHHGRSVNVLSHLRCLHQVHTEKKRGKTLLEDMDEEVFPQKSSGAHTTN